MSVELSRRWINGAYRYTASEGDRLNYALVEIRGDVANTEGVSIAVLPENTVIMLSAFSIVEAFDQPAAIHIRTRGGTQADDYDRAPGIDQQSENIGAPGGGTWAAAAASWNSDIYRVVQEVDLVVVISDGSGGPGLVTSGLALVHLMYRLP
jgi:hypothetical protein